MTTPLLFLFDLETTGLDVDEDRITEIASKVFNSPVNVSKVSFESLVYTPRPIPENGTPYAYDSFCLYLLNNQNIHMHELNPITQQVTVRIWVQSCISFWLPVWPK